MKIIIEIECEDAGELTKHLYVLIKDIKKACKKNPRHEFEKGFSLYDDNCYGTHELIIKAT